MSNSFYKKLALNNIKNNKQIYFPYMLITITCVWVFFIVFILSTMEQLSFVRGGFYLKELLSMSKYVIAIFSVIIILYGNSFVSKKRKKEFGIYNVLGMEKRHIKYIIRWEYFIIMSVSIVIGLILGFILAQFSLLILLKLVRSDEVFNISFNPKAFLITIILYVSIFLIIIFYNSAKIGTAYPIELIKSDDAGEKEPKTKILTTIFGIVTLFAGYYIAVTVKSPLEAVSLFFIAVILVIFGTYSLFSAGIIFILKLLKKNKSIYYSKNNFISISGMIYRMKQNAAGLASICILSTVVLVMLSTSTSMFIGVENALRTRNPFDVSVRIINPTDEKINEVLNLVDEKSKEYDITLSKKETFYNHITYTNNIFYNFNILEDYNKYCGTEYKLSDDEALVYFTNQKDKTDTLTLNDKAYKLIEITELPSYIDIGEFSIYDMQTIYIVLNNRQDVIDFQNYLAVQEGHEPNLKDMNYYYNFDFDSTEEIRTEFSEDVRTAVISRGSTYVSTIESEREDFYALHGGLLFVGVFLGILFLLATTLIIYYKQITEGYQDNRRFRIMQKIGMSQEEIKDSIKVQILQVFFIPLVMSIIHTFFAFPIIVKLLKLMSLADTSIFIICTIFVAIIFGLIYMTVYILTAKSYYKIISQDNII